LQGRVHLKRKASVLREGDGSSSGGGGKRAALNQRCLTVKILQQRGKRTGCSKKKRDRAMWGFHLLKESQTQEYRGKRTGTRSRGKKGGRKPSSLVVKKKNGCDGGAWRGA